MKHRIHIGVLLAALLVLASCHSPRREAMRMLARAEALADTRPDSTARLIDSVLRMPVYFSERQRMEMALLQGEALFSDAPLDDDGFDDTAYRVATSPELERAAAYYAKKKRYARAAHAALYSGYVQHHYNEKENAMRSYKAAEQYGLLSNDSLTVARAEYRIGKMLYYEGRNQEALIWQANASDRWGNISSFTEGDIQVDYDYDTITGLVNGIVAKRNGQTLLGQACHWTTLGNLQWRTDTTLNLKESFGYDAFNRLTSAIGTELDGGTPYFSQSFGFDQKGNVTAKTGLESYAYNSPTNPYAVTGVQPAVGQEGLFTDQTVTYTSFDKIDTVNQGGKTLTVNYGIDRQRVQQTFTDGDNVRTKRYFTPLYECVTGNGVTKNLHYLTAGTGLFAIFVTQNNQGGTMHYTLKDHQGSLTATVHGNTVERLSYDAWGRRRNPVGFGYSNVPHTFDRGYTLHEHYDDFDLINMNGRLYDPVLGRMLSPDIAIQDEHNAQAYNRYSYCFNNPLRFTDPSGYVVEIPPEYINLFEYAKDINHFRDLISELGIDPNSVQYSTEEAEGRQVTTVSWMIGGDKYDMVKYDYIYLRDYYQQYKNGSAATCFWALEAQWDPQTKFDEDYFMECAPGSYSLGLSVRELSELFVGTQIGDNYFPGISSTYHFYNEKEITDANREYLLRECFDTFRDGEAMMFLLPGLTIKHDVNAASTARLQINGKSSHNDYSVWIWDSSKKNGGYKLLNTKDVFYRFIIAK